MAYQKQIWENLPSQNTPLSADRLNHMEDGIYDAYEHGGGGETLPVGSEIEFDGQSADIPEGWEAVDNTPIYSTTTEYVCGTWIDGKTIYRKTINMGNVPNSTSKDVNHNISNIDEIVNIYGIMRNPSNHITTPLNMRGTGGIYGDNTVVIRADRTKVTIGCSADYSSNVAYVTLEYTKASSS